MFTLKAPVEPVYPVSLSTYRRLYYAVRIRFIKFMVKIIFRISKLPGLHKKSNDPTYIKCYPVQPKLKNHIFVPKAYEKGDSSLPLFIDIHGGGFCICDPDVDNEFCRLFADRNKILVVSLDYPKAPESPFPTPIDAVTDLVKAVLQDETLPFNRSKVAIGGFSAGGNISLSVSQDKSLREKINGVCAFYPVVNFVTPVPQLLATRPSHAPPDMLEFQAPMFNACYLERDQDLRDPRLSVAYAPRETLPAKLCIFGCEFDMLCEDAEDSALNWADVANGKEMGATWEKNGVRWEKVMGFEHGFNQMPTRGEQKIKNDKRALEMYDSTAEWLFREVYTS